MILLLLATLTSCSHSPVVKHCEPVPEWMTAVPDKPSADLPDNATFRQQLDVINRLDSWADLNFRRLRSVAAHQKPCLP